MCHASGVTQGDKVICAQGKHWLVLLPPPGAAADPACFATPCTFYPPRYPTLAAEASSKGGRTQSLQQFLGSEAQQTDASFYVLLRAVDRFEAAHGRFVHKTCT